MSVSSMSSLNAHYRLCAILPLLFITAMAGGAEYDEMILKKIEEANSSTRPSAGSGVFIYEHWQRPRYLRSEQFEAQIAMQFKALEQKKSEMSPAEYAEVNEVIPINMALQFMDDVYERWSLEYRFTSGKMYSRRTLQDYTTRLEVPENLLKNRKLRRFAPQSNRSQTLAWNGKEFRNFSQINDSSGDILAIIGTTQDKSLEQPPFAANIPPIEQLKQRVKTISNENDFKKKPAIVIDLDVGEGGVSSVALRAFFNADNYRFYALERRGKSGDETLTHREEYSLNDDGTIAGGEISQIVRFDGIELDQVFDTRKWTITSMDFKDPPDAVFTPEIPEACSEIMIYNGNTRVLNESSLRSPKTFSKLLDQLRNTDLTDAEAIRLRLEPWRTNTPPPNRKSILIIVNSSILLAAVALWIVRARSKAKVGRNTVNSGMAP
ncbi:MAG: hypothetical protein U0941_14225 [Planctomycetaceae bacterium]